MKRIIRLSSFLLVVAVLDSSCEKLILTTDNGTPLAGTWILTDAAEKDSYGWYTVTTGVENGTFYFYPDGTARYTEGHVTMTGSWNMEYASGGYYDEYGSYYTNSHQSLSVNLSDYYGDNSLNMYFDNVKIYANSFVATNYRNNHIERYKFSRY
jgi:hypothetical protein